MRLFRGKRIEKDDVPMEKMAMPMSPSYPAHGHKFLHAEIAELYRKIETLTGIIVAAGIAKRQEAGWVVGETLVPDESRKNPHGTMACWAQSGEWV